jgi:hypothetical protein
MDKSGTPESPSEHERDFVGWTESQAGILRGMPSGLFGLDTENLAEEIEDLGRSEIREVSSLLRQLLVHLIKLAAQPGAEPAGHWLDEVLTFQGDAVIACAAGIRQRIELSAIWRLARNSAARSLRQHDVTLKGLPADCPLTLDQLLADDFDPLAAAATISRAMQT